MNPATLELPAYITLQSQLPE